MRIKVVERLGGRVIDLEGVVLIVEDDLGNPIQLACELQPGVYELANISQESNREFNNMLRALGIDRLTVAESLSPEAPPPGSRLLYNPRA